jgi:hypothetical protein
MTASTGGAWNGGLGSAAQAAATQTDEQAPWGGTTRPEEKQHPQTEGAGAHDSPIGPPDAEQLEELTAQAMLNKAGAAMRQALQFPADMANFRTLIAELLLENGMLRLDVQRLADRVDRLERRVSR